MQLAFRVSTACIWLRQREMGVLALTRPKIVPLQLLPPLVKPDGRYPTVATLEHRVLRSPEDQGGATVRRPRIFRHAVITPP
jgi:hypothetical protein